MSLIEKAAERLERQQEAKARGRVQTPPRDPVTTERAATPPPQTTREPASVPSPQTARTEPKPVPTVPGADNSQRSTARKPTPTASTSARGAARSTETDDQTGSETFRINFKEMEKLGFVSRPFARGRLPEDLRAMKQRLMKRMNFFSLDAHRTPGRQQNVIMVSSSWASEGKTFTACNLALSLALEDRVNVLLVDAGHSPVRPRPFRAARYEGADRLFESAGKRSLSISLAGRQCPAVGPPSG